MSYNEALQAAGAEVLAYECFGSYQGDWWAKLKYENKVFWVHGSFGSCSSCDAYQSAGFDYAPTCMAHEYDRQEDCENCQICSEVQKVKLAEFGKRYIFGNEMTQAEAEASASQNLEWDEDAQNMVEFLRQNAIP